MDSFDKRLKNSSTNDNFFPLAKMVSGNPR